MIELQKWLIKRQKYIPFVVLIVSLVVSSLLRWHYLGLHSQRFFGLSFTDIANTHSRFMGTASRIPYIHFDLEYPVVLGFFFYLMGLIGASNITYFFFANSFFMSLAAVLSLYIMSKIHQLVSAGEFTKRALVFWSLSPSIFLFTTYNWDHLALLLMLFALWLVLKGRWNLSLVILCLGAFTKMFPGFLLLPFLIYIYKKVGVRKAVAGAATFLATALAINLPLIIYSFSSWFYFFKFSGERGAFGDNIWAAFFVLQNKLGYLTQFDLTRSVSLVSLGFFVLLYLYVNFRYYKEEKRDAFLQTCFLSILAYLVTAKTTSAPFNLWVLPFFVLLPVNIWGGLLYEWANAFVYYAFFQHIYYNDFLRLAVSPGHYFRLTYIGVWLRELGLLGAGINYLNRLGWIKKPK